MLANDVEEAVGRIDAAIDVLESVDLSALSAAEVVRLAGRWETLARRQAVVRGDIFLEAGRREVHQLGGASHKVLVDWLRITRRRPGGVPPWPSRWPTAPP